MKTIIQLIPSIFLWCGIFVLTYPLIIYCLISPKATKEKLE